MTTTRTLLALVLAMLLSACAYKTTEFSQLQMTTGNGNTYYGIVTREFLRNVVITVDIDRRIYSGNYELAAPNATFGFAKAYGAPDSATSPVTDLGRTNYGIAILSSTDHRIMRCDFTSGGTTNSGLCVDEAGRVYRVVLS